MKDEQKKDRTDQFLFIIVAIVAIVAIVIMILATTSTINSTSKISGAATSCSATTCNHILPYFWTKIKFHPIIYLLSNNA